MAQCQTPCIVVYHYRLDSPEYLRDGAGLNAVVSFVPNAPIGFAARAGDFCPKNMRGLPRDNRVAVIADAIATCAQQPAAAKAA